MHLRCLRHKLYLLLILIFAIFISINNCEEEEDAFLSAEESDLNTYCCLWASQGYCRRKPRFMSYNCGGRWCETERCKETDTTLLPRIDAANLLRAPSTIPPLNVHPGWRDKSPERPGWGDVSPVEYESKEETKTERKDPFESVTLFYNGWPPLTMASNFDGIEEKDDFCCKWAKGGLCVNSIYIEWMKENCEEECHSDHCEYIQPIGDTESNSDTIEDTSDNTSVDAIDNNGEASNLFGRESRFDAFLASYATGAPPTQELLTGQHITANALLSADPPFRHYSLENNDITKDPWVKNKQIPLNPPDLRPPSPAPKPKHRRPPHLRPLATASKPITRPLPALRPPGLDPKRRVQNRFQKIEVHPEITSKPRTRSRTHERLPKEETISSEVTINSRIRSEERPPKEEELRKRLGIDYVQVPVEIPKEPLTPSISHQRIAHGEVYRTGSLPSPHEQIPNFNKFSAPGIQLAAPAPVGSPSYKRFDSQGRPLHLYEGELFQAYDETHALSNDTKQVDTITVVREPSPPLEPIDYVEVYDDVFEGELEEENENNLENFYSSFDLHKYGPKDQYWYPAEVEDSFNENNQPLISPVNVVNKEIQNGNGNEIDQSRSPATRGTNQDPTNDYINTYATELSQSINSQTESSPYRTIVHVLPEEVQVRTPSIQFSAPESPKSNNDDVRNNVPTDPKTFLVRKYQEVNKNRRKEVYGAPGTQAANNFKRIRQRKSRKGANKTASYEAGQPWLKIGEKWLNQGAVWANGRGVFRQPEHKELFRPRVQIAQEKPLQPPADPPSNYLYPPYYNNQNIEHNFAQWQLNQSNITLPQQASGPVFQIPLFQQSIPLFNNEPALQPNGKIQQNQVIAPRFQQFYPSAPFWYAPEIGEQWTPQAQEKSKSQPSEVELRSTTPSVNIPLASLHTPPASRSNDHQGSVRVNIDYGWGQLQPPPSGQTNALNSAPLGNPQKQTSTPSPHIGSEVESYPSIQPFVQYPSQLYNYGPQSNVHTNYGSIYSVQPPSSQYNRDTEKVSLEKDPPIAAPGYRSLDEYTREFFPLATRNISPPSTEPVITLIPDQTREYVKHAISGSAQPFKFAQFGQIQKDAAAASFEYNRYADNLISNKSIPADNRLDTEYSHELSLEELPEGDMCCVWAKQEYCTKHSDLVPIYCPKTCSNTNICQELDTLPTCDDRQPCAIIDKRTRLTERVCKCEDVRVGRTCGLNHGYEKLRGDRCHWGPSEIELFNRISKSSDPYDLEVARSFVKGGIKAS